MSYFVREIDGMECSDILHTMNAFDPSFPALASKHFSHGYWWIAQEHDTNIAVAFAALVPFFGPKDGVGYFKRAYVLPEYRGQGLQLSFMRLREDKARQLGWRMLVSECSGDNVHSASNFSKAGFSEFIPEQPWGAPGSIYFAKILF
ncbi:GNAT family N-acetyltransferase [Bradyrhizobium sp. Tv2a-2]|uniref:GNAT family N-acetyltransferase n=1 Tax=Bradyrhizobium sp. Tv2a-2 TaxID=113395 RepID=UPI00042A3762|nr:GNAT family N-acetyltransferase [Bradyrhizobium sp. Tv2a-2]